MEELREVTSRLTCRLNSIRLTSGNSLTMKAARALASDANDLYREPLKLLVIWKKSQTTSTFSATLQTVEGSPPNALKHPLWTYHHPTNPRSLSLLLHDGILPDAFLPDLLYKITITMMGFTGPRRKLSQNRIGGQPRNILYSKIRFMSLPRIVFRPFSKTSSHRNKGDVSNQFQQISFGVH